MADGRALALHGAAGPVAPLQRCALWLTSLSGWRRHFAALLLGVVAVIALPPVDLTPVLAPYFPGLTADLAHITILRVAALLVSFPGLVWLADGSVGWFGAFALGWSFGFGFFVAGLFWIAASLFVDIARFWWLLPFAVMGLPAGLAIFTGAALAASYGACRWLHLAGTSRILALAVFWAVAEWLRGHVLTGFPWNLIGYVWSGASPGGLAMLQTTSLVGIYGLSFLTVAAAALPARFGDFSGQRALAGFAAVLLFAIPASWGGYRLAHGHPGDVPGILLRLVQPSIPETLKNDPRAEVANFRRLLALSTSAGWNKVTTILWPEAAAPPFLDRDLGARMALAAVAPPGGYLITGSVRTDPPPEAPVHVWNGLVAIDREGTIRASYDKFHLVPFGEYVPLRGILPMEKITPGAIDFSAGPGPRTIAVPDLPSFSPLICYEAIFPGAVTDPKERPAWLLNITNDAWYGYTSGPFQHFAIARVRAIEEGLPLVRVANNGVSAVFDPYGRVQGELGLDAVGVLDRPLPEALKPTLYSRLGDLPYFFGLLLTLVIVAAIQLISRRSWQNP